MFNLKIGQKVLVGVVAIFLLFAAGLSVVVGNTSSEGLTTVRLDELTRMSQILSRRIVDMEQNAAVTVRSLEESDPLVSEIQLLTNLGPYYADPASYFAEDFTGKPIEDADQIYLFQSQIKLAQLLRSAKRLNDLTSISFYLVSPFDVVDEARPVLALHLDEEQVVFARFARKGDASKRVFYSTPIDQFQPPPPDYFDISSAYSAPPERFYAEQNFEPLERHEYEIFPKEWQEDAEPHSEIVVKAGVPVLQTWYPVEVPVAHPETWEEETVPVGLALVEQELDAQMMTLFADQLGLDVGFARVGRLLITSLDDGEGAARAPLGEGPIVELEQGSFYFALQPIDVSGRDVGKMPSALSDLQAVVFSPVSEVRQMIWALISRIGLIAIGGAALTSFVVYLSLQYLVNRPLAVLMRGVERISAGDLSHEVPVQSKDEVGQLAAAFNDMAARLRDLVGSLERRVRERTQDLEQRARYLEATSEVAREAASELDMQKLLARVVRLVSDQFGFYHAGIFLLDASGEWAVLQAASSEGGQRMLERGHRLKVGETGTVGYVTARGEPRIALDVGEDAVFFDNPDLPETRSAMTLPLQARGEIIGALDVQSREASAFTDEDAAVLQVLADQVAMAISNAQLFQQAQESLQAERRAYGELSRRAWQELLRARSDLGYVGDARGLRESGGEVSPVMAEAAQTGQVVREDGATLAIPVEIRGQVVGVARFRKPDDAGSWSADEVEMMETVTEQLNVALESARLHEETQRRAARERLTSEVTTRMRETLDMDSVLKTAVREMREALGLHDVMIELADADGRQ